MPFLFSHWNSFKQSIIPVIVLIIVVGLLYSPCLFNDFAGDDFVLIVQNDFYRSPDNIPRLFQKGYNIDSRQYFLDNAGDKGSGSVAYRPVVSLTFFADYFVWGDNPFGFHLTNLIFHLINTVLVFLILHRMFPSLALWIALLFATHPVQTEAVCAIGYRSDLLACLFTLLSFLCWRLSRDRLNQRNLWYSLSLAAYVLALFSKESAVMLPAVIWLYESLLSDRSSRKRLPLYGVGYGVILALYLIVYLFVFPNPTLNQGTKQGGLSLDHLLLCLRTWSEHLLVLLQPWKVNLLPALYKPPIKSLTLFKRLLDVTLLAGSAVCSYYIYKKNKRMFFWLGWLILFYIPVSNIILLPNPLTYRYLYLPSVGWVSFLGIGLWTLGQHEKIQRLSQHFGALALTMLLLMNIIITASIIPLWKNNYSIAQSWIKNYPQDAKGYEVLGREFYRIGEYPTARDIYLKALSLNSSNPTVLYELGICYIHDKADQQAFEVFNALVQAFPDYADAHYGIGRVFFMRNEYKKAAQAFDIALSLNPYLKKYHYYRIQSFIFLKDKDKTLAAQEKARQYLGEGPYDNMVEQILRVQKVCPLNKKKP